MHFYRKAFQLNQEHQKQKSRAEIEAIPFTGGQHWVIEELSSSHPHYWNGIEFFPMQKKLDLASLEQIISCLLEHHEALRIQVVFQEGKWHQIITELDEDALPLIWICLSDFADQEQKTLIEQISIEVQNEINTLKHLLLQFIYFDLGIEKPGLLLRIINHFISDDYSNSVLSDDFRIAYQDISQGKKPHLPDKTTSFRELAQRITSYINSPEVKKEIDEYWLTLPWAEVRPIPLDIPEGRIIDKKSLTYGYGTKASSRRVEVALNIQNTKTLLTRALDANTQIMDLLLTAISRAFRLWTGS